MGVRREKAIYTLSCESYTSNIYRGMRTVLGIGKTVFHHHINQHSYICYLFICIYLFIFIWFIFLSWVNKTLSPPLPPLFPRLISIVITVSDSRIINDYVMEGVKRLVDFLLLVYGNLGWFLATPEPHCPLSGVW